MTTRERVIAYKVNVADYPWDLYPAYKQDKEDAMAVRDHIIHLEKVLEGAKTGIKGALDQEKTGSTISDVGVGLEIALNILINLEDTVINLQEDDIWMSK